MQSLFTILITLQFLAVVSHDRLDIPGWTHGRQVREVLGRRKLWLGTAINAINGARKRLMNNLQRSNREAAEPLNFLVL